MVLARKRKLPTSQASARKLRRVVDEVGGVPIKRVTTPVGEPWPKRHWLAVDAPQEETSSISSGRMFKDVAQARGWCYRTDPCHGTFDEEEGIKTFFIKEFEATVRGKAPAQLFAKKELVKDGYRLKKVPLPPRALWLMTRLPFRVPGTCGERVRDREDFINILVEHGHNLPGKNGNYRMGRFPGTETLMWKNNLTTAFQDTPWYPSTYIMPRDKAKLLKEMRSRGNSLNNLWIGKPKNDYGGAGIRVWKGTDPDLVRAIKDSSPNSLIQHYLADPLLVGGYKFHMRIHMIITSVNPVQAFVQENGVCLFATKPYTISNNNLGTSFDPPVHVTNMGLNSKPKNKDNFFRKKPIIGSGQQIRVKELIAHLEKTCPSFDKKLLWQQILRICADTASYIAKGVRLKSDCTPDRHFEMFGMDLMLDKDMKVWMCEVNTDPGLDHPDDEVLGSPNPDFNKELRTCQETYHDFFALLGMDATAKRSDPSLRHWFKLDNCYSQSI